MTTPYTSTPFIQISPYLGVPQTPGTPTPTRGRGAKRGRKPRGTVLTGLNAGHLASSNTSAQGGQGSTPGVQFTPVQWTNPSLPAASTAGASSSTPALANQQSAAAGVPGIDPSLDGADEGSSSNTAATQNQTIVLPASSADPTTSAPQPNANASAPGSTPKPGTGGGGGEEDGEGEDELLPAMADDDYSAQLKWQSESKDNLKVLMDNFSPAQYDRFEAYRRHALPKQAVRRVIQQTTGQQVSQPVAQIVAGFAKVFVGEIVEKARAVQSRRNDTGPLTPDHLREAYRLYQAETGRVGSARAGRGRRLFVR
ncbi:hypothetical protein HYDPIDRAFT_108137 [Hydnomerulius pinastri MD-312]|nr:hypothetical protein HYDPIDRAFT_108137 [Hydnomerulius pinastri MD-312]